ncbi:nucleotidyltransferase domain-containing protein [Ferrimonas pelagia]|uniref:Aminoglycoside 6-adenylyltransferase n=1 Tax=Ferrimonas pelagia TaxID=1177826 RepID=A0ABP9ENP6_9GAMM
MFYPSTLPNRHRQFIERALPQLQSDPRLVGVAASGSYANNTLDPFSDLDLVIAVEPEHFDSVMRDRSQIAAKLAPDEQLLAHFTGEHVGEPRLVIGLYLDAGAAPLHVDLKFVQVQDAAVRVDEPCILWARDERLAQALAQGEGRYPRAEAQWIEDRFWIWVHYAATKIGRGEYFEALDCLGFLRGQVLGPLAQQDAGFEPCGVRKLEQQVPEFAMKLQGTVALCDAQSLVRATRCAAELYQSLRSDPVCINGAAQQAALAYLDALGQD